MALAATGTHLALFEDDTCIYATEEHECRVLWKLQRVLPVLNSWCEHWTIKINGGKTQAFYFSRRLKSPWWGTTTKWTRYFFVSNVTYLGVTFDRRMTWRHHIERTITKTLRTYVRNYSLFRSGRLRTNIKCMLYTALIRSVMTYACPTWEHAADAHLLKLQRLQKSTPRYWKSWQVNTSTRTVRGFQNFLRLWLHK
jgi:hypothetical protein